MLKPFSYGCVAVYFIHETESEIGLNIATTINRTSAGVDGCEKLGQADGISLYYKNTFGAILEG